MKHRTDRFFPFPWEMLQKQEFVDLSASTKTVIMYLLYFEHRFAESKKDDKFFVVDSELVKATGLSLKTITTCKQEIRNKFKDHIDIFYLHWCDSETKRMSKKHVTGYRIKFQRYQLVKITI